jgi:hypothetical protein
MRSRTVLGCVLIGISLVIPANQIAAEPSPSDEDTHKVVEHAFDDDQVFGDLVAPLGEVLTVRGKHKKETLVRARRSFIDQLVRAVEDLEGRVH